MPLYMCRWENGDVSFVWAANKGAAVEALDEVANAEGCPIILIRDFMAHFGFTDEGELELQGFGEVAENEIFDKAYPLLEQAIMDAPDDFSRDTLEGRALKREAVAQERERVRAKPVPEPATELGRRIKREMDVPTSIIDRIVRKEAGKTLKKFRPKGKPYRLSHCVRSSA
jgi:hypothetical protein